MLSLITWLTSDWDRPLHWKGSFPLVMGRSFVGWYIGTMWIPQMPHNLLRCLHPLMTKAQGCHHVTLMQPIHTVPITFNKLWYYAQYSEGIQSCRALHLKVFNGLFSSCLLILLAPDSKSVVQWFPTLAAPQISEAAPLVPVQSEPPRQQPGKPGWEPLLSIIIMAVLYHWKLKKVEIWQAK